MDLNNVLVGGLPALLLLIFLIQTAIETFDLEGKVVPAVGLGIAVLMMLGATYLPDRLVVALALAVGLTAIASASVRYVKEGPKDGNTTGHSSERVQGDDYLVARGSRTKR